MLSRAVVPTSPHGFVPEIEDAGKGREAEASRYCS